ncbi:TetR/AcrR family transcriptional regulator [Chryseobacterium sp. 2R14A]|uniref:TetR/AcrR family transcriptional regulator n=1 Tax=Chryseobacterium sp. 2R14A TaxID=3380353 RepID=UPI003CF6BDF4
MGSKERILKKKAEVSNMIIEVAMDILNSEGIDGITIRNIASRIEYSPPVIYSHYQNKDALTDQLIIIGFNKLLERIISNERDSGSSAVKLEHMFRNYIEFALENKPLYLLMSHRIVGSSIGKIKNKTDEFSALLKAEIQRMIPVKKNTFQVDDIYFGMISLVHGIVSVCYTSDEYSIKDGDAAVRMMIKGFLEERK